MPKTEDVDTKLADIQIESEPVSALQSGKDLQ